MSMPSRFGRPVERDRAAQPDRPADRPGEQRLDRLLARLARRRDAAVRLHHVQRRPDLSRAPSSSSSVREVPLDAGRDVGVEHRGGGALVLAPLARDLVGERHREPRALALEDLADAQLVLGVRERVHEADGDRLDPLRL